MSVPRVKICGLTNHDDVDAAITAGADALGFIVDVPVETPRELTATTAANLVRDVPPFVTSVAVTMADDETAVAALTDLTGVDAVQVHGHLADATLDRVTATVDIPVIAGVDGSDTTAVETAAAHADAVLLDSVDDTGAGGTGTTHDWTTSADIIRTTDTPVILAGGLTPDNVGEAVRHTQPYGVDVATGVEATGGKKDHAKVQSFITTATQADS